MKENPLFIPVVIACFVVLGILGFGISSFAKGGSEGKKNANKLMQMRLAAQAFAVMLIVAFVLVGRGSK